MAKKINGYAKMIMVAIAIAGIIWNAATLHNDVKHLKNDMQELKKDIEQIKTAVFVPEWKKINLSPEIPP